MPILPTLVDRAAQCAAVEAAVGDATGGLAVVAGLPGTGRSSLLDHAMAGSRRAGIPSYLVRCTDLERSLALGVAQRIADLAALRGTGPDAVLHPALSVPAPTPVPAVLPASVVAAARPGAVLLVDDAQWCDQESLDWLVGLAARDDGPVRIVLVVTVPALAPESTALIDRWPTTRPLRRIDLAGLGPTGSRALLERLVPGIRPELVDACHAGTAGNPQLLCQLAASLVAGHDVPAEHQIARALGRHAWLRLTTLPPDARRFAAAVAVLGDHATPATAAAVAEQDLATAATCCAGLVGAGLLESARPPRYRYRAVRAAVHGRLTAVERRHLHGRAAAALARAGADQDAVATHLLAAPPVGRGWAVRALAAAARGEERAGRPREAHAYLVRRLDELAVVAPHRVRRAELQLGRLAASFDLRAAATHLRRAASATAAARDELAEVCLLLGDPTAEPDTTGDPLCLARRGPLGGPRVDPADRPRLLGSLRPRTATDHVRLHAARAARDLLAGHPRAVASARKASHGPPVTGPDLLFAWLPLLAADLDVLGDLGTVMVGLRARGRDVDLAFAHTCRAVGLLWRGELRRAERAARAALRLADRTGLAVIRPLAVAVLAEALLDQGRPDEAEALGDGCPWPAAVVRARQLRDAGDAGAAIEVAMAAGGAFAAHGGHNPALLPWRGEAAMGYALLGGDAEATELADEQLRLARRWGAPRAVGHALRVAAAVAGGGRSLDLLGEAVAVLAASPARLEHALALTDLGAALRRSNNRGAARVPLRQAMELALACGAAPLLERIRTELAVTGEHRHCAAVSGTGALSPQERRVVDLATTRASNAEIAQALHISVRTVKDHLSSIYRKLGVTGRHDLAGRLTTPVTTAAGPEAGAGRHGLGSGAGGRSDVTAVARRAR